MKNYNYSSSLKCLPKLHLDSNSQRYALKKIVNGPGKDKLDKMLLVAHCCIPQHLFLTHHDHKVAWMKITSWTWQGTMKSLLYPTYEIDTLAKFLFPFSQCSLSAGSIQMQTKIPLTWNHGFNNSKNFISISLRLNSSTSIFLDLRQIIYTSQTSALSFLFVAV